MSAAAVMLVKDEVDIIAATLRNLLEQTDYVFVSDNGSTDGTLDVLQQFEGRAVEVIHDPVVGYYQSEKTSKLAATAWERGFDWVVPCDADEIWYSPFGRIADVLARCPDDYLFAHATLYNHIGTDEDPEETDPVARLGWRLAQPGVLPKVACRTGSDLWIGMGNHNAMRTGRVRSDQTPSWQDQLIIRHFPWRSEDQFIKKITNGALAYDAAPDIHKEFGKHWRAFGLPHEAGFVHAVRNWYWEWGYRRLGEMEPEDLVYDPAPAAVAASLA